MNVKQLKGSYVKLNFPTMERLSMVVLWKMLKTIGVQQKMTLIQMENGGDIALATVIEIVKNLSMQYLYVQFFHIPIFFSAQKIF